MQKHYTTDIHPSQVEFVADRYNIEPTPENMNLIALTILEREHVEREAAIVRSLEQYEQDRYAAESYGF